MLSGGRAFLLSEELLTEYRLVLLRPKIVASHGLSPAEVDEVLIRLAANAIVVDLDRLPDGQTRDRSLDAYVVALLDAVGDGPLVTGDLPLLRRVGARVRRPRELFAAA